ncbi:50S ribosomal protein L10 [Candidatus Parcubacteria bacterium]|nr:50S ribosomal protein L10 [Candidatus Parcubacteria bacterium]
MKSKAQKKSELKSLTEKLPKSQLTVITSFAREGEKGLSVSQMAQLKRLLRELHSEYVVTKKTLMDRALSDSGVKIFEMQGSLGLVLGNEDPYAVAKRIYEYSRKNQALQFFGALFEGNFISKEQFLEMAKMPSKEVLIGRLFGMMKYPITSFYIVMNEIAKKKQTN